VCVSMCVPVYVVGTAERAIDSTDTSEDGTAGGRSGKRNEDGKSRVAKREPLSVSNCV